MIKLFPINLSGNKSNSQLVYAVESRVGTNGINILESIFNSVLIIENDKIFSKEIEF